MRPRGDFRGKKGYSEGKSRKVSCDPPTAGRSLVPMPSPLCPQSYSCSSPLSIFCYIFSLSGKKRAGQDMTLASQTWPKSTEGAGMGFWWLSRCGGEKGISRERPGGSGLGGKLGSGCSGGTMLDSAKSPGQLIPQLQGRSQTCK